MTAQELLDAWREGNFINVDALESAHQLVADLVVRVEELERQVESLNARTAT
jgi:hypothetical protein